MKKTYSYSPQGLLFLILAQLMVGINIVFSKYILSSMPILFILVLRFILASVSLLALHFLLTPQKLTFHVYFSRLTKRDWLFIVGQALCAGVLFNIFILWGLQYTDANVAGIITSALPAIIAILSWILLGEQLSGKKAICVGFATLGLVIMAFDKLNANAQHSFLGDALVLISLLPEATYYILSKMHVNSLPVFLISALLNGINALILLVSLCFISLDGVSIHTWDSFILVILGLSSGFFYVFWYFGCQKVDGVMTSLSTAVMPLGTVLIAWIVLGEQLSIIQAIGMSLVILSIAAYAKK